MAAIAVPLGSWALGQSVYGTIAAERFREFGVGRRGEILAIAMILGFEIRWLGVLVGLWRARGRPDRYWAHWNAPSVRNRRRRRRFALGAIFLSALVALTAAEIVFRVFDLRPQARPRSAMADYLAVDNTRNALGIREDWSILPEDDLRLRILFLGDSMVYGDGVERDECFCHFVEELLSDQIPGGVVTINVGIPGTDPARQLDKYKEISDLLKPRVVVQVAYPNDLGINMHHRLDEIYRIRDDDVWVGKESYVLNFAERQIRYWIAWKRTIDYFRGGFDSKERDAAWAKFEGDLGACRDAAREDGAVYALVLFPWLVRLSDYPLGEVHERMKGVAKRLGVAYLDLLPTYAGRDAEKLRVSLANEHPNVEGHRIAAERIARFLREEVLPSVRH